MPRTISDNVAFFISFCMELYKKAHSLSGKDVFDIFSKKGVTKFLESNYEVLHTQSPKWLLEEINEFVREG